MNNATETEWIERYKFRLIEGVGHGPLRLFHTRESNDVIGNLGCLYAVEDIPQDFFALADGTESPDPWMNQSTFLHEFSRRHSGISPIASSHIHTWISLGVEPRLRDLIEQTDDALQVFWKDALDETIQPDIDRAILSYSKLLNEGPQLIDHLLSPTPIAVGQVPLPIEEDDPTPVNPAPIHPAIALGKSVLGILWSSVRHPGKAIEIHKSTGDITVINEG